MDTRNAGQQRLAERADRQRRRGRCRARRRRRAAARSPTTVSSISGPHEPQRPAGAPAPGRSSARRAGRGRTGRRCTPRWPAPCSTTPATSSTARTPIACGVGSTRQEERRRTARSRSRWRSCRGPGISRSGIQASITTKLDQHHRLPDVDRDVLGQPGVEHVPRRQAEVGAHHQRDREAVEHQPGVQLRRAGGRAGRRAAGRSGRGRSARSAWAAPGGHGSRVPQIGLVLNSQL